MKKNIRLLSILVSIATVLTFNIIPASGAGKVQSATPLIIWADGTELSAMRAAAAGFTAKYGVPVTVTEVNFFESRDKFIQAAPEGKGPDILVGVHDILGGLVAGGLLEPVNLTNRNKIGLVQSALDAFTYNGKVYGLPYGIDALAMYVNTKLVPAIPTTWTQLMATSKKLQESGKAKYGVALLDANPYFAYPLFGAFGGYVFGKNADGSYNEDDLGLDSAGSIAAAQAIASAVTQGLLVKGLDYGTMQSLFYDGKIGMMFDGPWSFDGVKNSKVPFTIAKIPAGTSPATPFIGVRGIMVSSFSKNKLAANVFLSDYMGTTESMQKMIAGKVTASAWKLLNMKPSNPLMKKFGASAADGQPTPAIPAMGLVWEQWGKAMTSLLAGGSDPAAVMKSAAANIRTAIKKSK